MFKFFILFKINNINKNYADYAANAGRLHGVFAIEYTLN